MIPVVTPEAMAEADRAAPEPFEVLVARAGAAVAHHALKMLGGGYGRRVVVVAGKGNNGADGRDAARRLARRGARVEVIGAADAPHRLPGADLVVDAAYGTGFRGEYEAPDPGHAPVLAVDVPSGVDGLTGEAGATAVRAERTVTFAALKPGLLFLPGAELAGRTVVADIGLDVGAAATVYLVEAGDVGRWIPFRDRGTHKWRSAVWVVAGSPGMTGAAQLCARAAMRSGAGTVRLGTPGCEASPLAAAPEVVGRPLPAEGWARAVVADAERAKALVVGPGLGRSGSLGTGVRELVTQARDLPAVVDADALFALGTVEEAAEVTSSRRAATVLTPHDGELRRMTGSAVPSDRIAAARGLAVATGTTVLLKGPTSVVAGPTGPVLLVCQGDARLATAGTGDVLAGMVGAFLALGLDGPSAAAAAAFVHGAAARLGWERGLVAGDLPELIPAALAECSAAPVGTTSPWTVP